MICCKTRRVGRLLLQVLATRPLTETSYRIPITPYKRMLTSKIKRNHGFFVEEERCRVAQESPQVNEEPKNMKPIAEDTLLDVADYLMEVLEDVVSVREEVKQLKVMVCVLILLVIVKIIGCKDKQK
uniref:Uncharacterized protein n=1 Tax=Lactuca sativa TaxID=4236 RepID=A0A9R1XGN2_LACSA|nr:hypothetical protein LSAT_V11C400181240 [Lactuca sativa]